MIRLPTISVPTLIKKNQIIENLLLIEETFSIIFNWFNARLWLSSCLLWCGAERCERDETRCYAMVRLKLVSVGDFAIVYWHLRELCCVWVFYNRRFWSLQLERCYVSGINYIVTLLHTRVIHNIRFCSKWRLNFKPIGVLIERHIRWNAIRVYFQRLQDPVLWHGGM